MARRRKSIAELQDEWLAKPYVKQANRVFLPSFFILITLAVLTGWAFLLLPAIVCLIFYFVWLVVHRHRELESEE